MDLEGKLRVLQLKLEHYETLCRDQATKIVDLEAQVQYLQERLAENTSHAFLNPDAGIAQPEQQVCTSSQFPCRQVALVKPQFTTQCFFTLILTD